MTLARYTRTQQVTAAPESPDPGLQQQRPSDYCWETWNMPLDMAWVYVTKSFKNYLRGLQIEVLSKESKIMKNKREDQNI